MSIGEDDLKFLLEEKNSEIKWDILAKEKNVVVYKNPKESLFTFKAYKQWDSMYYYEELIEKISDERDVIYLQFKTPPGVSYRDNCLLRYKKKENDGYVVIAKSITHDKCPIKKDFVRAVTHFHGVTLEKDGDNTKMFLYAKQDFGGYIPQWIINLVSKSRPKEYYQEIIKAIKKFKPKSKL